MENTCMDLSTTMSMLFAVARPQGWADLPIELLQSIIILLSCTRDLLAFIATCPNWCAAFMLAKPTLSKLFPPLIVQSYAHLSSNGQVHHTWQLMDPTNPSIRFHHQIPSSIMDKEFVGCSYGHAIFASIDTSSITIVDVFTGTSISPPLCPALSAMAKHHGLYNYQIYGSLTVAMSSPKACLFVSTVHGLFVWRIGSDAWQKILYKSYHQQRPIDHVVTFEDQIIAMGDVDRLYVVHLDEPQHDIILEELPVSGLDLYEPIKAWLVVCKDKLVLVARLLLRQDDTSFFYLDSSTNPARWLPAPDLDHAIFVNFGYPMKVLISECRSTWRCGVGHVYSIRPNRSGGKGGYLHLPPGRDVAVFPFTGGWLWPNWVLPSVIMSDGIESTPKQCTGEREGAGEKTEALVRYRKKQSSSETDHLS